MRSAKNKTKTQPKFITVYLPKDAAVRDLFWKKSHTGTSVSGQMLRLLAKDLKKLGLITADEFETVRDFKFYPTTKISEKQQGPNYSLYIPKDLRWLLSKLDENLGKDIPYTSRSRYIWTLFLNENLSNTDNVRYLRGHESRVA